MTRALLLRRHSTVGKQPQKTIASSILLRRTSVGGMTDLLGVRSGVRSRFLPPPPLRFAWAFFTGISLCHHVSISSSVKAIRQNK